MADTGGKRYCGGCAGGKRGCATTARAVCTQVLSVVHYRPVGNYRDCDNSAYSSISFSLENGDSFMTEEKMYTKKEDVSAF